MAVDTVASMDDFAETQLLPQYLATAPELEPPADEADMGGWTASVYSPEQQARLHVDQWGIATEDSEVSDEDPVSSDGADAGDSLSHKPVVACRP